MASSPSPSISPPSDSTVFSPPSPSPPADSAISPTSSVPHQTGEPPSSPSIPSAPPPQSPPADVPPPPLIALPPSPPASPPPTLPAPPPPSPLLSSPSPPPPPSISTSPPPPSTTSPSPPSTSPSPSPPSPSTTSPSPPPPSITSPPPPDRSIASPPPPQSSPPSPDLSSPPPPPEAGNSPPPSSNPRPPSSTPSPPPPDIISPSPPPPAKVPTPPSPAGESPKESPPSPKVSPPPSFDSQSPPSVDAPPPRSTVPSPPLSVPSSSSAPPPVIVPASPSNSSARSPTTPPTSVIPELPIPIMNGTRVTTNKGGLGTGTTVAVGSMVGVLVLSLVIMAMWFVQKRKRRKNIPYTMPSPFSSQNSDSRFIRHNSSAPVVGSRSDSDFMYASSSEGGGVGNSKSFPYEELQQATGGYSSNNLLGEGGFGCVYKGTLADGRDVAVKQLKVGGGQGEREFRAEVEIISRVHHRHLVSLVGYCVSDHQRLLVYDYVPNDTLHYHLHCENKPVLGWATRVRIAAGAARGIAYLHEDCHPRIIHRDIKSSNILLDINFEAQVADFGLAKLALDSHTHVTTRVMGTFGYMAPEYATSGKLTDKSDVFSYGVVLLELITGRRPVDSSQPSGDESLVEWARPLLAQAIEDENFAELVDPRLDNNYVDREMFRMIEAAAACVRYSAVKRPRMSQVVRALDSLDEMSDLANGVKPGQSGVFDSAEHSAQIRMFQRMAFGSQDYSYGYSDRDRSRNYSQSQSSRSKESRDQSPSAPIRSRQWNI